MKHRLKKIEDKLTPDKGKEPFWVCFGVMDAGLGAGDLTCEAIEMFSHRRIEFKPYIPNGELDGVINFDELFEKKQSKLGDSMVSYYVKNELLVGTEEPQVKR